MNMTVCEFRWFYVLEQQFIRPLLQSSVSGCDTGCQIILVQTGFGLGLYWNNGTRPGNLTRTAFGHKIVEHKITLFYISAFVWIYSGYLSLYTQLD